MFAFVGVLWSWDDPIGRCPLWHIGLLVSAGNPFERLSAGKYRLFKIIWRKYKMDIHIEGRLSFECFLCFWWTFLKPLLPVFAQLVITFQCNELGADASTQVLTFSNNRDCYTKPKPVLFSTVFLHLLKVFNHFSGFMDLMEKKKAWGLFFSKEQIIFSYGSLASHSLPLFSKAGASGTHSKSFQSYVWSFAFERTWPIDTT